MTNGCVPILEVGLLVMYSGWFSLLLLNSGLLGIPLVRRAKGLTSLISNSESNSVKF